MADQSTSLVRKPLRHNEKTETLRTGRGKTRRKLRRRDFLGNNGSRPKESYRQPMYMGEKQLIATVNKAIKELGEDHPIVLECLNIMIKIARGEPGYVGRYVPARLSAVNGLLDRVIGTPPKTDKPIGESKEPAVVEHVAVFEGD